MKPILVGPSTASAVALHSQALVQQLVLQFRSMPFYLVAVLLHLLFLLIFATLQVPKRFSPPQITQILTAPPPSTPVPDRVTPPVVDRSIKQAEDHVRPAGGPEISVGPTALAPIEHIDRNPRVSPTQPIPSGRVLATTVPGRTTWDLPLSHTPRTSEEGRDGAIRRTSGCTAQTAQLIQTRTLLSLRWLRANQNPDGSWGGSHKPAMTGLALLTFLAHGETQEKGEFAEAVQKGVQWLMDLGQKNQNKFGPQHIEYQHAIATYALAEDCIMSHNSAILPMLDEAVRIILKAQCPNGSWQYGYDNRGAGTAERAGGDLSISGWNIQALKAAKEAGVTVPGLDVGMQKAAGFVKEVYNRRTDRFGYSRSGAQETEAMTGVGVLSLQFLGEAKSMEASRAVAHTIRGIKCNWDKATPADSYAWYYINQALFLSGDNHWKTWEPQFRSELLKHQLPDGHWPVPGSSLDTPAGWVTDAKDSPVYHTTLCCLMLEVYYRFSLGTRN